MGPTTDQRALDEFAHPLGDRDDVASLDPWTDTPRSARLKGQFRWLVAIAVANLSVVALDQHGLGDSFSIALSLRLLVVTPLALLALGINRWSSNQRLQTAASACATISLIVITAVIGQFAQEPFASRYMMAAQFVVFGAALFASLPWRATQIMTVVATAAYTLVVASALQFPPSMTNLDLIGFNLLMVVLALSVRKQKDVQMDKIAGMRRVDALRTAELRRANARLSHLSSTDALTGVFNRRHLDVVAEDWSASIAPSLPSGVLMIDVDRFKLFNDRGGHAEGDRCLQLVAAAIRTALRSPDDIVVRYGGEEFVAILPGADLSEAVAVAERLRHAVHDLGIPHPSLGADAFVTVSVGACASATGENILAAIGRADKLLYAAKEAGRNRVSA
jgi:diguanylate cyclase (GGDEF)-like protein